MRFLHIFLILLLLGLLANFTSSSIFLTDNQNVAVPSDNGTSSNLNITGRMQQYVGYYGNINTTVILSAANNNTRMYTKLVTQGKVYFFRQGQEPTGTFTPALNNSQTDGNFSLSGYYVTGNHFALNSTVCGVESVDHLNTTDNYMVGIFKDSATTPRYFLCTDIRTMTSANGMGTVSYEIVVPKTAIYTAYDVFVDLE